MIRPAKHLELKTCIIHVASVILTELRKYQMVQLDELDSAVRGQLGEPARFNFIPALSFLYSVGKLEYSSESDAIYLLEGQTQ